MANRGVGKRVADLAAFFGPAVLSLSHKEQAVLEANMGRLIALRKLDEVDAGKLTLQHDVLYDLVMEATGSEKLAGMYRAEAIKAATWKSR